jgi:hypothetical protein
MSWGNWGGTFGYNSNLPAVVDVDLTYEAGAKSEPGPERKSDGSLFGKILDTGIGITNTILGYKLQSKQISHGQFPTVGYDENGRPVPQTDTTAAAVLGGQGALSFPWLWILLIAGAFLLLRK